MFFTSQVQPKINGIYNLMFVGRPENFLMDMPILANYLQFTETNWRYQTEPNGNACLGFDEQRCKWPRGKVVGKNKFAIFDRNL